MAGDGKMDRVDKMDNGAEEPDWDAIARLSGEVAEVRHRLEILCGSILKLSDDLAGLSEEVDAILKRLDES